MNFADDMGVWKYFKVKTTKSGDLHELVSLGKKRPTEMSRGVYRIKKNYSCHHAASDLSRTVIFIDGMYIRAAHILIFIADHTGSIKDLCTHLSLVNMMSKCNLMVMYVVTQIHTLEHYLVLCRKSRINKCAVAIQHLKLLWQKEEGGIVECRSTSCLPRNRRQVSNARYSSASRPNHDLLYGIMEKCMKSKCEGERFVQCVQAAPESS